MRRGGRLRRHRGRQGRRWQRCGRRRVGRQRGWRGRRWRRRQRRFTRRPRRRRRGRWARRGTRQCPVVNFVATRVPRIDAGRAVGARLADLGAQLAVNGADAVVLAARLVAAHALPRETGADAVVARRKERKALFLVLVAPLVERGGRGGGEALAGGHAVRGRVVDLAADANRVVGVAARHLGRRRGRRKGRGSGRGRRGR